MGVGVLDICLILYFSPAQAIASIAVRYIHFLMCMLSNLAVHRLDG